MAPPKRRGRSHRPNIDRLLDATPREKDIEKRWGDRARAHGWIFRKYKSEGHNSVPDRILLRRGVCLFIEFKKDGEDPTPLQLDEHKELRAQGFSVFVIDFYDKVFADLCLT